MTLGKIIETLELHRRDQHVALGFSHPHSYRGYYDDLAFEPVRDTTVGQMLDAARSALGATFEGYKGGEFTMDENTDCWLAEWGREGETLGPILLGFMLGDQP